MQQIPIDAILARIRLDNPWWEPPQQIAADWRKFGERRARAPLMALIDDRTVRRAVILLGPRRVGKTVLLHHCIQKFLDAGTQPNTLCYLAIDHPLYNGLSLETLLGHAKAAAGVEGEWRGATIVFDEIQYLKDWERHLKRLVDDYPTVRFVASGSAAAALRMKSNESGAGRFTDFLLPPLAFPEFLELTHRQALLEPNVDLDVLDEVFVEYINYGGYPEMALQESVRRDPQRYVKSDIVDKVLLRDLPSLYGISDTQELNALFTMLAYNTGQELSLDDVSMHASMPKNTLKRYLGYLEAAFLIRIVHRIDRSGRRFQRATTFKVYLTTPSLRSALFAPITTQDADIGWLVETALVAQPFHMASNLCYARWGDREIDLVLLDRSQKPLLASEIKYSNHDLTKVLPTRALVTFAQEHGLADVLLTSRTQVAEIGSAPKIVIVPAALLCRSFGDDPSGRHVSWTDLIDRIQRRGIKPMSQPAAEQSVELRPVS